MGEPKLTIKKVCARLLTNTFVHVYLLFKRGRTVFFKLHILVTMLPRPLHRINRRDLVNRIIFIKTQDCCLLGILRNL